MKSEKCILLLEDGSFFIGKNFGSSTEKIGEVVFNTSLTGYEEILTDPSYCGQIVLMCYPHIGNYGINFEDSESYKVWVEGFIVREYSRIYSNHRAKTSLDNFLKKHNVPAIEGIDTRKLVKKIREKGSMKGILSTKDFDVRSLKNKLKKSPSITGKDLVNVVNNSKYSVYRKFKSENINKPYPKIAVIDFGTKLNIIRCLENLNLKVIVLRGNTELKDILKLKPKGVVLSNGPGDPEGVEYGIKLAKELISYNKQNYLPILGICLGHQLIGLGSGAKTFKLKFGHHGANHPVKDLSTNKIEITSQNHNFCIDQQTLKPVFKITHINLNDNTLEGMKHKNFPIMSFQFHPENSPGPKDSKYIFKEFKKLLINK